MNNGRNPQPMNLPTLYASAQCGIAVTSCVSVAKSPDAVFLRTGPDRDRQRCKSCNALIEIGADCLRFRRTREPRTEMEERIYGDGDTVPMADYYNCEVCGGLFMALSERGYCVAPNEDMRELAREHGEIEQEKARA